MVTLFLCLILPICGFCVAHFLEKHRMRVAMVSYAVLCFYVFVWTVVLLTFDFGSGSFTGEDLSALRGSALFFSWEQLQEWAAALPEGALTSLTAVACALALTVLGYLAINGYRIYQVLYRLFSKRAHLHRSSPQEPAPREKRVHLVYPIWLRNCRLND